MLLTRLPALRDVALISTLFETLHAVHVLPCLAERRLDQHDNARLEPCLLLILHGLTGLLINCGRVLATLPFQRTRRVACWRHCMASARRPPTSKRQLSRLCLRR